MHAYMKLYIHNWLREFEDAKMREEGKARRPMTEGEFIDFCSDCMIEAQELILNKQ